MSSINPENPFRTFKRLWQRAPIWRLSGMSAAVLTLIFVLFFHGAPPQPNSTTPVSQASYVPQPVNTVSNVAAAPTASPTIGSSGSAVANAPLAAASNASPSVQGHVAASSKEPKVQTANLSLATPGNSPGASSDLDSALGGRIYSGSVNVDGYNVPLPTGNWVILSSAHYKSPQAAGELVFFGQVKNRRLIGATRITALHSTGQPGDGFPPKLKGCAENQDKSLYVASEEIVAGGHQSCWLIDNYFAAPLQQWADRAVKIPVLERAAAGDMTAKGVTYPQDFVRVRMTRTETWGLLEVAYLFSPEAKGIKSNEVISVADSDWTHGNISRFHEKIAYVDNLKQWGTQFWPRFKAAFDAAQK